MSLVDLQPAVPEIGRAFPQVPFGQVYSAVGVLELFPPLKCSYSFIYALAGLLSFRSLAED